MLRRLVALSVLLALVLTPAVHAANVKIRVEGKSTTIFGASQPTVVANNALQALDVASFAGEFYYGKTTTSFGEYVSQVGKYAADSSTGWVFKVNGVLSQVGAAEAVLKNGDVVLWYHTTFSASGGPRTLELRRLPGNCYVVDSLNDAGTRTRAANAVLVADGKRFPTKSGRACIGRHVGVVRATAPGAVRSNAVK